MNATKLFSYSKTTQAYIKQEAARNGVNIAHVIENAGALCAGRKPIYHDNIFDGVKIPARFSFSFLD